MSQKGSVKSNQSGLRNSFHVLSALDDHVDVSKAAKKKEKAAAAAATGATGSVTSSTKSTPSAAAAQVKKEAQKPVEKAKPVVAAAAPVQQKKNETKQEIKRVVENKPLPVGNESNAAPLMKMLIFAVLMLVLPIGAYYWSVNQAGMDLGEIKSALIAVLVVNVLLFAYILMAFLEESKQNKIKKH